MLKSVTPEDLESARAYDKMIPWEPRLKREIPLLLENLPEGGLILDVACATGRHSLELIKHGYRTLGIDISEAMVEVSRQNAEGTAAEFHTMDAASENFHADLGNHPLVYDGAIMLGNAIANTETLQNVKRVFDNLLSVIRPNGVLLMQTIHRPTKPYYLPLRNTGEYLLQRIMIPIGREVEELHNVELNVNVIGKKNYENQSVAKLYMLTNDEFRRIAENAGWQVQGVYSSYNKDPEKKEDGATAVWILKRPDIEISDQTRQIAGTSDHQIKQRALEVWEDIKRAYRSMQTFTFLHPRVSDNPFIEDLLRRNSILDIGCGVGADTRYLKLNGVEKVDGFDVKEDYIRAGEKIFGRHEGKFLIGELGEILEGEKYDAMYAGSVIHLIPREELPAFLSNVYNGLEERGIFVARTIVADQDTEGEGNLRSILSVETLRKMLEEAGFRGIEFREMEDEKLGRPSDTHSYKNYAIKAEKA